MPFTYLGLPMGTTKPKVEHFAPLMNSGKTTNFHMLFAHTSWKSSIS
jgi:hypothetical protein